MDSYKNEKLNATEKIMLCTNCGFPVVQAEVVENYGVCPNCDREFKPFDKPAKDT